MWHFTVCAATSGGASPASPAPFCVETTLLLSWVYRRVSRIGEGGQQVLYLLELKLRWIHNGSSSCSKAFEGLLEPKPAHTKMMSPEEGYVRSEGRRELLGPLPTCSTADPGPQCPFPVPPMLVAAVHSIALCLGCRGLVRDCA